MSKERELLEAVFEARDQVAGISNQLGAATEGLKNAETSLIEHMNDVGKPSFKQETSIGIVGVSKFEIMRASVPKENKEELLLWVDEECGRSDLIKTVKSIHHKTLESFVTERIDGGNPVPSYVKTYFQPMLKIVDAHGKAIKK